MSIQVVALHFKQWNNVNLVTFKNPVSQDNTKLLNSDTQCFIVQIDALFWTLITYYVHVCGLVPIEQLFGKW
jgi:hypothetical protein